MPTRDDIVAYLEETGEDILLADGFEDAFIGLAERCGQPTIAAYDLNRCIEILMVRDGMSEEEAIEFFTFNVIGAYAGELTPTFLHVMRPKPTLPPQQPPQPPSE
jgi:hypothetical protein